MYLGKDEYEKRGESLVAKSNRTRVNDRITDTYAFEYMKKLEVNLLKCGEMVAIKVMYFLLISFFG